MSKIREAINKVRKFYFKSICAIDIVLILAISLFGGINLYYSSRTVVTVTPLSGNSDSIVLRGALVGSNFCHASNIYAGGNWEKETYFCRSKDMSPITLKIPYGGNVQLVFFVGPNYGDIEISSEGVDTVVSLWNETLDENGRTYAVARTDNRLNDAIICTISLCTLLMFIWPFFRYIINLIKAKPAKIVFLAILLPIAAIVLYNQSLSSSPKVPDNIYFYGYDAAVYKFMGKGWLRGLIPYRDTFEQKGPFIFLVYMIGEFINSDWGVYLLQVISLWVTLIFCYFTAECLSNVPKAIISTLATLFFFLLVINEGAIVEEFNLPVLAISTYLSVKYLRSADTSIEHPPRYAFVYGLTCAVSLCFRVTNCVAICCFVACITIALIVNKRYNNLLHNAVSFILGVVAVLLPVCIYFWSKDALRQMIDGYVFQFLYTEKAVASSSKPSSQIVTILLYLSPVIGCAILSLDRNRYFRASMILCALAIVFMMLKLYLFSHYYIVFVTFVPIVMALFLTSDCDKKNKLPSCRVVNTLLASILIACISWQCFVAIISQENTIDSLHNDGAISEASLKYMELGGKIPVDDRDKVLGYNIITTDFWLDNDIYPCRRFGGSDGWLSSIASVWHDEIVDGFSSLEAKWIVVVGTIGDAEIAEIVSEYYTPYYSVTVETYGSEMTLYKKL